MRSITDPLSIRQLEVFVALVDQGSFTRAARHLGLSQSTVSGHIADLERRLGVLVVERGRQRVRPTAAGRALLPAARETLQAERGARRAVEELRGLVTGRLVVGGSTIPASYLLPPLLAAFHEQHPEISLRIVTGDSREILELVRSADLELGMVGARPQRGGLEAETVGRDRLVFVVPPDHELARRERLATEEVLGQPLVLREEGSGTREATVRALLRTGGVDDASGLKVGAEVGSTEAMKAAVRAGLGVAFVSEVAVQDELAAGLLVSRPVLGFEVRRHFYLAQREGAYLCPAARAFRDLALLRATTAA